MKIPKQKLLEILVTALLSAGIAFLQGLMANAFAPGTPTADPALSGAIGVVIRGASLIKYV